MITIRRFFIVIGLSVLISSSVNAAAPWVCQLGALESAVNHLADNSSEFPRDFAMIKNVRFDYSSENPVIAFHGRAWNKDASCKVRVVFNKPERVRGCPAFEVMRVEHECPGT